MALKVEKIVRGFSFKREGKNISLTDPNPDMTPDEVMSFYAHSYTELTTATVSGPEIKNDQAIFEFKTTIGTKG